MRDYGIVSGSVVVRGDEKLTAFLELESAIRASRDSRMRVYLP